MGTETKVFADTKAQVAIRISVDPEFVGGLEDLFIPVGGWVEKSNRLSGLDHLVSKFKVLCRCACEMNDGSRPADNFFDGGGQ